MINAVIFVRPENYDVNAARCLEHCQAQRYHVVGVIPGDWRAAMQMLGDGQASVIVVSSPDQLDPLQEPRIEVIPKRRPRRRAKNASLPGRWAPEKSARSMLGL